MAFSAMFDTGEDLLEQHQLPLTRWCQMRAAEEAEFRGKKIIEENIRIEGHKN